MNKTDFLEFYNNVVKKIGERFQAEYPNFNFCDNPSSLYEEYLNQRAILRVIYEKKDSPDKALIDRHKVCACMTVAITKVRLLSGKLETDDGYNLSNASRINEQLAFMSTWELFKGFIVLKGEKEDPSYELPKTFHNASFLDTITRSLFYANQLDSLSTPLIANIFYLLEMYCNAKNEIK